MDLIPHTGIDAHDEARAYELIIFGCDGVLVDGERITARVLAEMLGESGFAVTLHFR